MELTVPLAAALFLGALTLYASILVYRELTSIGLARAGAAAEHDLLRERIADLAERRRRETEKAERTWDGFRKFVIARKVLEAQDVCSFYLEPHDRRALPSFMPGQYLTFRLNVPGQAKPVVRCYSLSDSPKPDYFRVTIKRLGPPPGKADGKPGLASNYFHQELEEGDIVDVKAPAGQFFIDPKDETPAVLIGGGIGLTPVLSMLNAIVDVNARRDVWLFYGVRHRGEHVMADHLKRLAAENSNVHLHVCYSDPRPGEDREGEDYTHGERVSIDLMKRVLPSNAPHFYLCGPPPMMQATVEALHGWGVPDDRIHYEAFGPASVKSAASAQPAPAAAKQFEIAFARSEKRCAWDGRSTLLEIAEANGVRIDSGCRAGNCGTCVTALREGSVDYPSPPGTTVEAGSCLACVALPKSNVVLEA